MQIMEVREEIAGAQGLHALVEIAEGNNKHLQSSLDELADAFACDDKDTAARILVRLQYLRKAAEEIHAAADRQAVHLPEHL